MSQLVNRKSCELCRKIDTSIQLRKIAAVTCDKCYTKHFEQYASNLDNASTSDGSSDANTCINGEDVNFPHFSLDVENDNNSLTELRAEAIQLIQKEHKVERLLSAVKLLRGESNCNIATNTITNMTEMLQKIDQKVTSLARNTNKSNTSYSEIVKSTTSQSTSLSKSVQPKRKVPTQVQYDPERTVIIDNIRDKSLVNTSANIKKNLSNYYPRTKFDVAFRTAKGKVQLQLRNKALADELIANWKPNYLGSNTKARKPITQHVGILRDCDVTLTDEEVLSDVERYYDGVKFERFKRKDGYIYPLGKLIFRSRDELEAAIDQGVPIGQMMCNVEEFVMKNKPTRCYKCQAFNHVAKWCNKDTKCGKCAGKHEMKSCNAPTYKCANCEEDHAAWDKNCREYLEAECRLNT